MNQKKYMVRLGGGMSSSSENIIKTRTVIQNKQEFLIGVFKIKQVFEFTRYTERLIVEFDEEGFPIYNTHVQRKIERGRVQKIADYLINDPDATFPTNIVLHLPREMIVEQKKENEDIELLLNQRVYSELKKKNGDIYISIIDGQHRIKGIEEAIGRLESECQTLGKVLRGMENNELIERLKYLSNRLEDLKNIELVVSFFIDKTLEYQAMVFSTINRTQKRVSQSLVYSLFGLDTGDTPHKTALEIVLRLNSHKKSPFYKRIKLYGGSYSRLSSPPLSQATMVRSIVNLISENLRESENDRYKKRKDLLTRSERSTKFLPFRVHYALNKDYIISDILFYYFNCVKEIFLDDKGRSYWEFSEGDIQIDNILQTTVGYDSLLKILIEIMEKEDIGEVNKTSAFTPYLKKAKSLKISDISRYSFNNRGKKFLYLDMSLKIWKPLNNEDFRLKELRELEVDK